MSERKPDIQFNSKELIGVFMLLIVASSLIFGLGVYVGKGMSETKALLFLKQQLKEQRIVQKEPVEAISSENSGEVIPGPSLFDEIPSAETASHSYEGDTIHGSGDEVEEGAGGEVVGEEPGEITEETSEGNPVSDTPEPEIDESYDLLGLKSGLPRKAEMAKIFRDDAPQFSILLRTSPEKSVAEKLAKALSGKIDGVFLQTMNSSGVNAKPNYQVLLGRYQSRGHARSIALVLLRTKKIDEYNIEQLK